MRICLHSLCFWPLGLTQRVSTTRLRNKGVGFLQQLPSNGVAHGLLWVRLFALGVVYSIPLALRLGGQALTNASTVVMVTLFRRE